ncbi:MAG TPA: hypothetical protein VK028_07995 [Micromonosporaceae bacterium]|nr:hypothetical protein [Micromonosporaceae bacterium]
MSAIELLSAATEAAAPIEVYAEGRGVFDTINREAGQLETTIKVLAAVLAAGFVIWRAFKTGFAVASIVIALLLAAVFVWGINNIDILESHVDEELNSAPTVGLEAAG